jgi:hypothetical protein
VLTQRTPALPADDFAPAAANIFDKNFSYYQCNKRCIIILLTVRSRNMKKILATAAALLSFDAGAMDADSVRYITDADEYTATAYPSDVNACLRSFIVIGNQEFIVEKVGKLYDNTAPNVRSIFIPASVEIITPECFQNYNLLTEAAFEFESLLRVIGNHAFYRTSLRSLRIPAATEIIGKECFYGCYNLKNITFEDGSELRAIKEQAFCQTALPSIHIPAHVTAIGWRCFSDCKSLAEVTFEDRSELREIEKAIFANCPKLNPKPF